MSGRRRWLAVGGSLAAALAASACCWLPLLLIAFGVSAAGVSAEFTALRPWFLGLAAVLLAVGFWLTYFSKPSCQPGEACATPRPRLQRWNRAMLWFATVAVAGIALFPEFAGALAGSAEAAPPADAAGLQSATLHIEGMTCEACATHIRQELLLVPGVEEASVRYPEGTATVYFAAGRQPPPGALAEAVARAGYKVVDG